MATSLPLAVRQYLSSGKPAQGTRNEYATTLKKWAEWGKGGPIEQLSRRDVREFLDWVYERAVEQSGTNPGRTANKAREHLRAVISWAWEQDLIEAPPRFPKPRYQRDVAGRHYLTTAELNSLYFATYQMRRPRGWSDTAPVGRQWRSALVLFFNYGLDTGTIWRTLSWHEPLLWRHVFWESQSPDPDVKARSRWGWLFYRRVKTGKTFYRPMNQAVNVHLRALLPDKAEPDDAVFSGGGSRPNARFAEPCKLAALRSKLDLETRHEKAWELKDLRKTCATFYDEHMPESSIEILGHSVAGITYRHYAHRAPLAFKAITTLPQPSAFMSLVRGIEGECPCCKRQF